MKASFANSALALATGFRFATAALADGEFAGATIEAKLISSQHYEALCGRIAGWEKATGAKANIISQKNHFELDKEYKADSAAGSTSWCVGSNHSSFAPQYPELSSDLTPMVSADSVAGFVPANIAAATAPMGREAEMIEQIWRDFLFTSPATATGPIMALAQAAIDTALWDMRGKRANLPLHLLTGGAKTQVPMYSTEGGGLHLEPAALVDDALAMRAAGFKGAKIKIGKPTVAGDAARLTAVRAALGDAYEIMTDANQSLSQPETSRRLGLLESLNIAWFAEPLPADDIAGHARLTRQSRVPIAVGESLYSPGQFADYIAAEACGIVQADGARIGGITPRLKVAHLAEAHNLMICAHFLMELHVSLVCAVPNAAWLEYIPQLDDIAAPMARNGGDALAPTAPGLGIDWDHASLAARSAEGSYFTIREGKS